MSDPTASSAGVSLVVKGPTAGAELSVYDSSFRLKHSGIGEIAVTLAPGLYDVEARLANDSERKSVALVGPPQKIAADEWSLKLRTAAPLPLSSTWRQSHQQAAAKYSKQTTATAEGDSRLLIFARSVKRGLTGEWEQPGDRFWTGIKLKGADGRLVSDLANGVESDIKDGWCAFSVDLAEGGYVVSGPSPQGGEICMPLWLQPAYGTCVFVPVFDRPALDAASIVMAPKEQGLGPENQGEAEYGEALLAGFRRDKDLMDSSAIQKMLLKKFDNPFAGIIAAYALCRSGDKSGVSTVVISNLRGMLGNHPANGGRIEHPDPSQPG